MTNSSTATFPTLDSTELALVTGGDLGAWAIGGYVAGGLAGGAIGGVLGSAPGAVIGATMGSSAGYVAGVGISTLLDRMTAKKK